MPYDRTFQAKVWPVIVSLMEIHISPAFSGRLASDVPGSLTQFPVGVYQSQDAGGKNDDYISQNGWRGLVTIRSIDTTQSGAMNHALAAASGVLNFTHATYNIDFIISRPIRFPVEKLTQSSIYTAGIIIDLGIYPKII